jgi:PAS domain S-box-containing protein
MKDTLPWHHRSSVRAVSFLPVPFFLALLIAVHWAAGRTVSYDPVWLIFPGNLLFIGAVSFLIALVALRNYNATGRVQILLLGCGVLIFGAAAVAAGAVRDLPGGGNLNVTIYNSGALGSAAFHFTAAIILLCGFSPKTALAQTRKWLVAGYAGSLVVAAVLTAAAIGGFTPVFFVQGHGPTVQRQFVLGAATALFVFAFLVFLGTYFRIREVFLYWYSCALALTAISLTAFLFQHAVGSALGWVGRAAQYAGGIYFLLSLLSAVRSSQERGTSFNDVLTAALSAGEEQFRALAENTPDAIFRFDRELCQVYVNPAGLRLIGKTPGAVIGRKLDHSGMPEAQAALWKGRILEVFRTGRRVDAEDYIEGGSGGGFFESSYVPEHGSEGEVANVLVVSRDLTGRKRAEDQLAASLALARQHAAETEAVLAAIYDAVLVYGTDMKVIRANSGFVPMYGFDPVGLHVTEITRRTRCRQPDGSPLPLADQPTPKALRGELVVNRQLCITSPKGDERFLETTSMPLRVGDRIAGTVTVWHDVTERHSAEEALREARASLEVRVKERTAELEEAIAALNAEAAQRKRGENALRASELRYRSLFEKMDQGFCVIEMIHDAAGRASDYRFLEINPAFEKQTGLKNALGKTIRELVPDNEAYWYETYDQVARTGLTRRFTNQTTALGRVFDVFAFPVGEDRDHKVGILFKDITEQKRIETALRESYETLERRVAERTAELARSNEDLEQFAYAASHDLQEPLRMVSVYTEMLARKYRGHMDEQADQFINWAVEGATRMTAMLRGMLEYSRLNKPETVTALDSGAALGEAIRNLEAAIGESGAQVCCDSLPPVRMPEGQVVQLFQNLIANAIRYRGTEPPRICVSAVQDGSWQRFTVKDNGVGIDPRFSEYIFKIFRRLGTKTSGTGIGLAICKRIVERQGGRIWVESEPGQGAEFHFTLPAPSAQPPSTRSASLSVS